MLIKAVNLFRFIACFSVCASIFAAVTVVDGLNYSSINPNIRLFRMYYPAGALVSDPLPVVVWIHGGGWYTGGRGDSGVTPKQCAGDQTIACWLAEKGYVVFSIDYTLVKVAASGGDLSVTRAFTVAAGTHYFTNNDVGSALNVLTAAGWNPGGYRILSTQNGEATLDASPGNPGAQRGPFSVIQRDTLWPAQWQDCNCFLRYLAESVGVRVPGSRDNIVLMGHSAGGHLSGILGLGGNNTFATNCEHTSTNYSIAGIVAASPPSDLATLYALSPNAQSPIRNLLGCLPGYGSCDTVAGGASVISYVGHNLPAYTSFSGASDTSVLPSNVQETSEAFADLNPPVPSQWTEFPPPFGHPLDLYYAPNCSVLSEPSPCGSAGSFFQDAWSFMQSLGRPARYPRPGVIR